MKTLIKSADIIYLPYVRNQRYLDQKRSDIFKYCKILNKSIYLFPPVSSNILFDLPRNLNVKKIFVITKNQQLFLKKLIQMWLELLILIQLILKKIF